MKKTIVIKVHPIGSTKNTVAKTPEKNESVVSAAPASESEIETRIIKVIKHGTDTISGIPLSELSWGDTFFVHGIPTVNYTETLDGLKRNFFSFWGKPFSFDDVDAYEPEQATQANTQETAKNETPGVSRQSDASMTKDEKSTDEHSGHLIKVKKAGSDRITGCLFSELKPGDIFYRRGKAAEVLCTGKNSLIDTALTLCYPEDAAGWDTYEPTEALQADAQESAKNAGPGVSQESDASTVNDSHIVKGVKKGTAALTGILFRDLKTGDTFFQNGKPIMVGEDAHLCGDASYDGYLVYDRNGNSYFPEDADLYTFEDMAKNVDYDRVVKVIKNRDGVIRGCLYRELKPGDFFFYREHPIDVKDFAGTFMGSDGVQYTDIVRSYANQLYLPGEMDPYVPEKARSDKPAGKGLCDNDRILVKRNDSSVPCSVFSHNLNVGDVVIAINANALREEDFDRCAIVRRNGSLLTITLSDLQADDKVLALP